jgi:hypothetical protein
VANLVFQLLLTVFSSEYSTQLGYSLNSELVLKIKFIGIVVALNIIL